MKNYSFIISYKGYIVVQSKSKHADTSGGTNFPKNSGSLGFECITEALLVGNFNKYQKTSLILCFSINMQGLLGFEVLLVIICLMLYILSAEYLEKKNIEYINESSLAILLGLIIGIIVLIFSGKDYQFSSSVVFYFLLPPIIFAAGFTLTG
jgi:hypothetical protein